MRVTKFRQTAEGVRLVRVEKRKVEPLPVALACGDCGALALPGNGFCAECLAARDAHSFETEAAHLRERCRLLERELALRGVALP